MQCFIFFIYIHIIYICNLCNIFKVTKVILKKWDILLFHCLFSAFITLRSRENLRNLHGGNESTKWRFGFLQNSFRTQSGLGDMIIKFILWFSFLHFMLGWAHQEIWGWTDANAVTSATFNAKDLTRTAFWAAGRAFRVNRICEWPIWLYSG